MNHLLIAASGLTAATWLIHTFVGGREIARPLLQSAMAPIPKLTSYYCWHLVTLTLGAMALAYAYAAVQPGSADVAVFVTLLAASFMLWSVVLTIWKRRKVLELPQWMLFALITGVAVAGLIL